MSSTPVSQQCRELTFILGLGLAELLGAEVEVLGAGAEVCASVAGSGDFGLALG